MKPRLTQRWPLLAILPLLWTIYLASPGLAHANDDEYQKGWFAFQAKNYALATQIWRPLAENGHIKAALGLAAIHENGLGVRKDPAESARWYQIAANQGSPEAQHDLGVKYFTGHGVAQELHKAFLLWKQAAEQGLGTAQSKLAYTYLTGRGTDKNPQEAVRWYRQAATQGNGEAMYNLSQMFSRGSGVRKDPFQAQHWLEQAAKNGYAQAQLDLGLMYLHGESVNKDLTAGESLLRLSAEQGLADAQYYLGTLYRSGQILKANPAEAKRLLQMAADQGHHQANLELNEMAIQAWRGTAPYSLPPEPAATGKAPKAAQQPERPSRQTTAAVTVNRPLTTSATTHTPSATRGDTPGATSATTRSTGKAAIRDADWILNQGPDQYVIQLASVSNRASAMDLAGKLQLPGEVIVYAYRKDGQTLYSIVTGLYANYAQAKAAISGLPAHIRKNGPWVRNVGIVHQLINGKS